MKRSSLACVVSGLACLLALMASPAAAQALADEVPVEVWVIQATKKNAEISPELKNIAGALKDQFKFTGYKLVRKASDSVAVGKAFKTDLTAGYRAEVTPREKPTDSAKLSIVVFKKDDKKLNTTVTVQKGKFQLLGGWKIDGDDALIVAVTAR
ncbi:hypothetical protein RAS1_19030 [Phycisphaerae bacterium RAS1]|nr:hypothetical protein RAS1_19030 [Phycisphaerae bacterium RAS1]